MFVGRRCFDGDSRARILRNHHSAEWDAHRPQSLQTFNQSVVDCPPL